MTTKKKYKHPKVALCRYCGGRGYLISLDEREKKTPRPVPTVREADVSW